MIKKLLRHDVALSPPFTVTEKPCRTKLDQNEAPFELPQKIKKIITDDILHKKWNRYPQPNDYLETHLRPLII
jgi:histidinol-phosphate aminotransferase